MAHMPMDVFKLPHFRGDKIGDSARTQTFVKLLDEYFSIMPFFYEEDEDVDSWNRKRVAIRLNCFPSGSHAGIWYESCLETNSFDSYEIFKLAFLKHFGTTKSDLVSTQLTWNNLHQRPSESVSSFYMHFCKVMNQLHALGHDVSDLEAMGRFQTGVLQSLREKVTEHRLDNDKMDLNLLYAYHNTLHSATGYTPHQLLFGWTHRDLRVTLFVADVKEFPVVEQWLQIKKNI